VTPQVASNKRLQKMRRPPTVFCHFQRRFFSTAFHLSDKDTINLWVAYVKKLTKSMRMNTKTIKKTIWKHIAVSEDLARLCMHDHKKLGQRRNEIQKMVNAISLVAATLGNVQVFKWALWNDFYIEELWR
jgi:hypothetical protein